MRKQFTMCSLRHPLLGVAILGFVSCATEPDLYEVTDTNDDGRISTAEVETMLVEEVFEETDENEDGVVSFAEWQLSNPSEPSALFTERDTDSSGGVTLDEMRAYSEKKKIFKPVVREMDPDGNGYISAEEAEKMRKIYNLESAS